MADDLGELVVGNVMMENCFYVLWVKGRRVGGANGWKLCSVSDENEFVIYIVRCIVYEIP